MIIANEMKTLDKSILADFIWVIKSKIKYDKKLQVVKKIGGRI